jgi:hypothetical protein
MLKLMRQPLCERSAEYADNRISLFSAQWGKCAVTGRDFQCVEDIHCHHKQPHAKGGNDKYDNLVLVFEPVHILIHATNAETIGKYMQLLNLSRNQMKNLNKYRELAGLEPLTKQHISARTNKKNHKSQKVDCINIS